MFMLWVCIYSLSDEPFSSSSPESWSTCTFPLPLFFLHVCILWPDSLQMLQVRLFFFVFDLLFAFSPGPINLEPPLPHPLFRMPCGTLTITCSGVVTPSNFWHTSSVLGLRFSVGSSASRFLFSSLTISSYSDNFSVSFLMRSIQYSNEAWRSEPRLSVSSIHGPYLCLFSSKWLGKISFVHRLLTYLSGISLIELVRKTQKMWRHRYPWRPKWLHEHLTLPSASLIKTW